MDMTSSAAMEAAFDSQAFAELLDQVSDLARDVHSLSLWALVAAVALVVIACRMPRRSTPANVRRADKRCVRNYVQELQSGIGKTFEIVSKDGVAAFGGVPTARVVVLDCDGTWALVALSDVSGRSKRTIRLAIRIDRIGGLREIAV